MQKILSVVVFSVVLSGTALGSQRPRQDTINIYTGIVREDSSAITDLEKRLFKLRLESGSTDNQEIQRKIEEIQRKIDDLKKNKTSKINPASFFAPGLPRQS